MLKELFKPLLCKHDYKLIVIKDSGTIFNYFAHKYEYQCKKCGKRKWSRKYDLDKSIYT